MGTYVYSKVLSNEQGTKIEIDVFKESDDEFRPILTVTQDHYHSGFSDRRSFPTSDEARSFFDANEDQMINEALRSALKAQGKI